MRVEQFSSLPNICLARFSRALSNRSGFTVVFLVDVGVIDSIGLSFSVASPLIDARRILSAASYF